MSINLTVEQKPSDTKKSEIESLIYLLDDPDDFIRSSVKERFIELGERCIPLLDEYQAGIRDPKQKEEILSIIRKIAFSSLEQEFVNFLENGVDDVNDLEKGMFIIARLDNPTLREEAYMRRLDRMANRIKSDIQYAKSKRAQLQILLDYIFREENFQGDSDDYFNPENSFLNRVMDRKKGIPISLALITIFIAHRLGMPMYGINMPMHFLLRFEGDNETIFLDPFNKGSIVTMDQCVYFLKKSGIKPLKYHFEPTSSAEMLMRVLRNLINSFQKANDVHRKSELHVLLGMMETMYA